MHQSVASDTCQMHMASVPVAVSKTTHMHHASMHMRRPPPIESRRAGLRGVKPEEQAHSSPDENRPSNDQAGIPEAGMDGPRSGSNAESRQQAADELAGGAVRFEGESEAYDEMQDDDGDDNQEYVQNGHHAQWGSGAAAAPMFHRSFAVGVETVNTVPYMSPGDTNHTFFT